jgi:hypothetical protein
MLKVKKIQKVTKRQNKKICDQANYLKGRVETMTNERKETNESVHKLERQQLCMQREIGLVQSANKSQFSASVRADPTCFLDK